jgi:hypothetical protein
MVMRMVKKSIRAAEHFNLSAGGGFDLETGGETLVRGGGDALPVVYGPGAMRFEEAASAGEIIGIGEAGAISHDFTPKIHLFGNKHRGAGGEGFGHHVSKIFLVRRQHK